MDERTSRRNVPDTRGADGREIQKLYYVSVGLVNLSRLTFSLTRGSLRSYVNPLTQDTIEQMKRDGIKRAVAFTQYPQYSCSTTGSSLMEIWRHRASHQRTANDDGIEWSVIDRWGTHPGLVEVSIEQTLLFRHAEFPSSQGCCAEHRGCTISLLSLRPVKSRAALLRPLFTYVRCGTWRPLRV